MPRLTSKWHCLLALGLGFLCATGVQAQARNLDEIREKGSIRFALYNDYPPYSVRGGQGLDLEIAGAIARRLKVKLDTLWFDADENVDDDLRNMVWRGHYLGHGPADVMIHAPVDRDLQRRTPQAKLIAPYYRESLAMARNTEKVGRADDMGFLADALIGVEVDSLASFVLLGHQGGQYRERIRHFKSPRLAVEAFLKGEVQAVMAQKGEVEGLLKGQANVAIAPPPIPGAMAQRAWAVGLAVKSSNAELAAAVEAAVTEMARDGELEKIFTGHGLTYVRP